MIAQVQEFFPNIVENLCLTSINNKHTFVFEDNQQNKGVFVSDKDTYHLYIENKTNDYFHFLQNDGCIMNNIEGGQCDYVIFNSKDFHFIDVKVTISKSADFTNHRKKAYNQIENTYKHYSNKLNFPNDLLLYGLVCFPSRRRIIKSSSLIKKKEFKVKYNIDLNEGNYILFE